MRVLRLLLCLALLASPTVQAAAFNPRDVDILGLRLGMTQQEILSRLAAQGIAGGRIRQELGPCHTGAAATCLQSLRAPTRDGMLLLRFVAPDGPGSETVWSIAYTLAGRGAGEPDMIRGAVLDRFGPPTSGEPPIWCAAGADTAGCNPPDQPQLTYTEGPDTSSTLTLSDPEALRRAP